MRVFKPVLILTITFLFTAPDTAFGQEAADKEKARRHYDAAMVKLKEADRQLLNPGIWRRLKASAVDDLTLALAIYPNNREYLLERASATDDLELGLGDINKVLAAHPNEADLYIRRAEIYSNASESDLALADLNKAIALEPNNPKFYCERAFFFMLEGDREAQMSDYNKAIEIDQFNAEALLGRSTLYKQSGDHTNALKDLNLIIGEHPEKAKSYFLFRAEIFETTKRYAEALADVNLAVKAMPDSPGPLERRAEIYRKMGKLDLAKRDDMAAQKLREK